MSQSDQGSQNQYLVGTCFYKDQLYIMSFSENNSLGEIYYNLAKKWAEISPHSHVIRYIVYHVAAKRLPVHLNNDRDVLNMWRYHKALKSAIVEIVVELKSDGERLGLKHNHISRNVKEVDAGLSNEKGDAGLSNVVDKDSRGTLKWYCNVVAQTNPGSTIDYETFPDTKKFRRIFICFNACAVGFFSGCRPLIFLDRNTPLKKGCLLSAMTKDSNDDLFVIAYAVVDAETDDNWEWFCLKLRSILDSHHVIGFRQFTFFSDRGSGLVKAVPLAFPGSHHALRLSHLETSLRKEVIPNYAWDYKEHLASVLQKAAYAPSKQEHDLHLHNIRTVLPSITNCYNASEPSCWANSLFPGDRWGVIDNFQEGFWYKWGRSQFTQVVAIVDYIRNQITTMMKRGQEKSNKLKGILCPMQENKLKANIIASRTLKVCKSSARLFQVADVNGSCVVDLNAWTCSCRAWQVYRIPCKHACACIESESLSGYDFTDPYYRVEIYRRTYKSIINPIPTFDAR